MSPSINDRRQAYRDALAWLSLLAFFVATVAFGGILLLRDLPTYLGFDIQRPLVGWEVLWAIVVIFLIIIALVYLGVVLWLLFARLFLSRVEVSKVVYYGPTTRFERWLFNVLFPERK
jgi:hypothetical protein